MANVYVEPLPKGSSAPITGYALEYAGGARVTNETFARQEDAVAAAKQAGHSPLIAHVRVTDKGKPDHWRSA